MRSPVLLFGVPIENITMDETLALIDRLVTLGRARGRTYQISTVNVDFLVNGLDDDDVGSILKNADVCLADGMPVVWGARMLGMAIGERVAGSDLVPLLIGATETTRRRVHIFGSAPDVADAARVLLRGRYPKATFSIDPGPTILDPENVDDAVIESIVAVNADVLCVALGNPKQERFIRAHRDRLGTPVMIGIGGSLDMLVGKRKRAPTWVQAIGMEWIVRAAQEPKRLGRRYAHDIRIFGPALIRLWRSSRRRRHGSGLRVDVDDNDVWATFDGFDVPTADAWRRAAESIADGAELHVTALDEPRDEAVAQMVGLVRAARRHDRTVVPEGDVGAEIMARLRAQGVSTTMLGFDR